MRLFSRPPYESEFTQFLNAMKTRDPGVKRRQEEGRALLWDQPPIDLVERRRLAASSVKRSSYVYE